LKKSKSSVSSLESNRHPSTTKGQFSDAPTVRPTTALHTQANIVRIFHQERYELAAFPTANFFTLSMNVGSRAISRRRDFPQSTALSTAIAVHPSLL
jgi:hypothetical protein